MAQSDGSDLQNSQRQQLRDIQDELRPNFPHTLPAGTLLFRCQHCEHVYPLNHFPRNDQRRYGIRTICKACLRSTRPRVSNEPDPLVTEKRCRKCHESLPVEAFYVDRSQPDGYGPVCRQCAHTRKQEALEGRHHDDVVAYRREQTLKLCGELGLDFPDRDIKRCRRCLRVQDIDEFVNDWHKADRKRAVCRSCHGS